MRRLFTLAMLAFAAACGSADASPDATVAADASLAAGNDQPLPSVIVYKTATCGCCRKWVDHLKENGFSVESKDVSQFALDALKRDRGVPPRLAACHTALVGDYVVEGHVPASDMKRMLAEKPAITGLAVPEMPIGSPGMEVPGRPAEPYDVVTFDRQGNTTTFSRH
jgi:hypothetical protein